jgi:hypothetical protein
VAFDLSKKVPFNQTVLEDDNLFILREIAEEQMFDKQRIITQKIEVFIEDLRCEGGSVMNGKVFASLSNLGACHKRSYTVEKITKLF